MPGKTILLLARYLLSGLWTADGLDMRMVAVKMSIWTPFRYEPDEEVPFNLARHPDCFLRQTMLSQIQLFLNTVTESHDLWVLLFRLLFRLSGVI